ncbi:unnamed protein product [Haemonchus placei]|uniref:Uncharacterized protein n=1 Tax=Haemonchus placei TaxID=6290 RepID=A0A0N4VWB1_HAEPC|nr:unnamed protein product [Haemonchus placei]
MLEWVAKVKFHADLAPSNQLKSYAYHAAEATPLPPMRRYEAGSRSSDELPPMPMRRSTREETSRPTSRVSAFDAYDGAQTNSPARSTAGQHNEYNSLPRGTSIVVESPLRLCSTLPRGTRTGQPTRVDSFNSLNSSTSNMPVLFEPRKATVARRPSRRQSIYAESIYGDMDDVVEVVEAVVVNGGASSSLTSPPNIPPSSSNGYTVSSLFQTFSQLLILHFEANLEQNCTETGEVKGRELLVAAIVVPDACPSFSFG